MPGYPISRAVLGVVDRLLAPRQAARNAEVALTAARRTRTWWHSAISSAVATDAGDHEVRRAPTA